MIPVIRILEAYGVHYWLKYTGHHSLHVVVPAENFPVAWGKLRLADYMRSLGWRFNAFFCRFCFQSLNDGGGWQGFGGGTGGTNMPYSINEDFGLLNYPVRKEEISGFHPRDAGIQNAKIRSFWREFPEEKSGIAKDLVAEVLRPFGKHKRSYRGIPRRPPQALGNLLEQMESASYRERAHAVAKLPWFVETEATQRVIDALEDRHQDVRKAAVKAMVGMDCPRCEIALREALDGAGPKLASWINRVLKYKSEIQVLRENT